MTDYVFEFVEKMRQYGYTLSSKEIIPDGALHRLYLEGDTRGKKNATYQITILSDGRAIGWLRDHKIPQTYKFISGNKIKMNAFQKKSWEEEIRLQKAKRNKSREDEWEKCSLQAREFISSCPSAGTSHEYLTKKNIKPHGIKQYGICLIIPIIDINGKIWNYQRIYPDGKKLYQKTSKIMGNFFPIYKNDNRDKIIICEGFATGAAIFEATGTPVICALQANNLSIVAKQIRLKYPNAEIIIAADNDHNTKKPDGTPWNPGIQYGTEAAQDCNGCLVFPPFPPNTAKKLKDFNDFSIVFGPHKLEDFFK